MERSVEDDVSRERRVEVLAAINDIVDPCSAAVRVPIGIVDFGLVESVDLDGGRVNLELLTTAPSCMFTGLFEEEVERRVAALPWVESVHVAINSEPRFLSLWDESRMSDAARAALARRYPRRTPRAMTSPSTASSELAPQ
jgi:metal-sulfur cluster biosynthetic enzyme